MEKVHFGERARKLMRVRKINTDEFAQRHGWSAQSIFNWLNQELPPSPFVHALCEELGMTMSDFWDVGGGSDPMLAPILEEMHYARANYPKTIQAHLFRWIWAGLKAERELFDKKRIDDAMGE